MLKGKKGFSLIELMVVVSIIAILMALGAVSYTTAQKKARDAKRRGDMRAVQNAFEQYYSVNNSYATTCAGVGATYLPGGMPQDPKPSPHPAYATSCNATGYCICAMMENETGNSSSNACNFAAGNYFCVQNQQ
jgi:prepilin-type N-terminal cleavage/methylation domain-containing protein